MYKIYVPDNSYACYEIRSADILRAYKTQPRNNSSSNYTDYYINNHYWEVSGNQSWSQYATLPTCVSKSYITTDYVYRNDFDSILIIVLIFSIFIFYLPFRIFSRFLGRWLRV